MLISPLIHAIRHHRRERITRDMPMEKRNLCDSKDVWSRWYNGDWITLLYDW